MRYLFGNGLKYPDTLQIGTKLYLVQQPFICNNKNDNGNIVQVLIPVGFITDYGSIPQILWSLFDPMGDNAAIFVDHDFLYQGRIFKRATSDWNLLEGLEDGDNSWLYRNMIYSHVRMYGYVLAWRKHTAESIKEARDLQLKTHLELCDPNNQYGIIYKDGLYQYA